MKTHRDLALWQLSMKLVKSVYVLTANFPKQERFGLSNQMRRAAVSIPSNVAEGAARKSHREFAQFVYIARGSLAELQTQLQISEDLGYCEKQVALGLAIEEIFAVMNGLIKKLA